MRRLALALLGLVALALPAQAAPLSAPCLQTGPTSVQCDPVNSTNPMPTYAAPSSATAAGITPVVSAALESNHVIKNAAGNFISGYVTTGAVAGWLLLANSAAAPTAGGAAIAPLACVIAPVNSTTSITPPVPMIFSTGITMVFSTSGCLTNTASTTVFFSGLAK